MTRHQRAESFTLRELLVVIAALLVLVLFLIPGLHRNHQKAESITCVNHLMQNGLAYRLWSNDHGDRFPASTPMTNGGWENLLSRSNASTYAWTNYAAMTKELGPSPAILVCPADERKPAKSFRSLSNTNLSYFISVNADDTYPQSILGGDRNLGPGTTPDPEYGFSPTNGRGNDVIINGPVCWSLKMHSHGNSVGAGNILLGDGSAQQTTSGNLYFFWMKTAWAAKAARDKETNSPGMRVIFP